MNRLLLALLFCVSTQMQAKPLVVATTTFLADITKNLAGNYADVRSLLPLGGDPHIYDPVPADARLISQSDFIVSNGLTLEGWMEKLLANAPENALRVVASTGVNAIGNPDHANAFDPHAWMSLENAKIYVKNISDGLRQLMPEHALALTALEIQYIQKIDSVDRLIFELIKKIPENQRVIITSHDAFRYFGNRYGMKVESALGTSTDAEVRLEDLNRLIFVIKTQKIPAVFMESTINPKLLEALSRDLHIHIGGKLFADSMGPEGSNASTYLSMIYHDALVLSEGLTAAVPGAKQLSIPVFIGALAVFFVALFFIIARLLKGKSGKLINSKCRLEIKGLTVSYDHSPVLTNCYVEIESGFVYGLIGQNGSGKSTLFKTVLGLIKPDAGTVLLNNESIDEYRKWIAYVPQKEDVDWQFPATVADVIMLGRFPHLSVFQQPSQHDYDLVEKVIRELEIEHLKDRHISELSGGQQQRVFIARSLCQEAEIYLFDEPFVGIDIATEEKIIGIIRKMAADGKTVVIIHHDLTKVKEYFDRLILVNGRIVDYGDVADVFTPENIRKTFSGTISFLTEAQTFSK